MSKPLALKQPDKDLIRDFFQDYDDGSDHCLSLLARLGEKDSDRYLYKDICRSLHTLKKNMHYMGLKPVSTLLLHTEVLINQLLKNGIADIALLSEVVSHSLAITKSIANDVLLRDNPNLPQKMLAMIGDAMAESSLKQGQAQINALLKVNDLLITTKSCATSDHIDPAPDQPQGKNGFLEALSAFDIVITEDLLLFLNLITTAEKRTSYWHDRSYLLCKLALRMNQAAGTPVDPTQLTAAVLMHDFGMTFTPLTLLNKNKPYTNKDKRLVAAHVRYSYDMLNRLGWEVAAEMVLQHHERCDGTGYPKGFKEIEICDGAKIIAIVDTFYACTNNEKNHASTSRKLMHAVLEINGNAGNQFSSNWVSVFNNVVDKNSFKNYSKSA